MSSPQSVGRSVVAVAALAITAASFATQPKPAALDAVELTDATPEEIRVVLAIRGRVDRVGTMSFEDGRFVFDLASVAWAGPLRRVRPVAPGVREYRWSQLSRDPLMTRFVVEAAGGWSCRHEPAPRGILVVCSGPPVIGALATAAPGPDIAVVREIGLMSPVEGLDAEALVDRSLAFIPQDMVRDGLPNFGAMRDDWLGTPRTHKGLDIYGDKVVVRSAAEGKVVGAGQGDKAGGWVKIRHGNGVETVYVHINELSVTIGDDVAKGQHIAVVDGAAGNAIQPQLHFELKLDGQSVDPVPYIFEMASEDLRAKITLANQRLAVLEKERASRVRRGYD
ncbi:MAG: M23 family metallopeptidase [Acidobacteriota bacterium]|nr:M23 family metallopeptidase [Acidobacteriota bacterium]